MTDEDIDRIVAFAGVLAEQIARSSKTTEEMTITAGIVSAKLMAYIGNNFGPAAMRCATDQLIRTFSETTPYYLDGDMATDTSNSVH